MTCDGVTPRNKGDGSGLWCMADSVWCLRVSQALLCGEYVVPGWDGEGRVVRCGATREYLPHDAVVCGDEKEEEQEVGTRTRKGV